MQALEQILTMTEAKPSGQDKYLGHCVAHGSKLNRDLSIKVAGERILLYCFAGCETLAICRSLGLEFKDLFLNVLDPDPQRRKAAAEQRDRQREIRRYHEHQQGALIDALREADYFVQSRRGLDISAWSHTRLNKEFEALADAYNLLDRENLYG